MPEKVTCKELKKDSKMNLLRIQFKGKKYEIDLTKELSITESNINNMIMENPSSYTLLCQLKADAIAKRDQLEREKDIIFSKAYISVIESNPKATKELANHKANASTKYQVVNEKFLEAKAFVEKLISICRAFEMKAQLMQTLSSNIRRE